MITGILPALITPMNGDGTEINHKTLPVLVDFLLTGGVDGFFVCGGSGEGLLLHPDERRKVLEEVVGQAAGRAKIIAHIGAMTTQDAQALAAHAETLHVDAIAAVPPVYFRVGDDAIFEHYRLISEAAPYTPLWVYQIPSATCVDINARLMKRLLEIDTVSGIKYSSYNLYDMANILALPQGVNVLSGFDEVLIAALSMGAHGAIGSTYNVMPATFVRIYRAARAGDWETAQAIQQRANKVIHVLLTVPMIAGVKAILSEWGYPSGAPRRPIPPLDGDARKAFLKRVEDVGLWQLEEESRRRITVFGGRMEKTTT